MDWSDRPSAMAACIVFSEAPLTTRISRPWLSTEHSSGSDGDSQPASLTTPINATAKPVVSSPIGMDETRTLFASITNALRRTSILWPVNGLRASTSCARLSPRRRASRGPCASNCSRNLSASTSKAAALSFAFPARSLASPAVLFDSPACCWALDTSAFASWSSTSRNLAFLAANFSVSGLDAYSMVDAFFWHTHDAIPKNVAKTKAATPSLRYHPFHQSWRLRDSWSEFSRAWISFFSDWTSWDEAELWTLVIGWLFGAWFGVSAIIRQAKWRRRRTEVQKLYPKNT